MVCEPAAKELELAVLSAELREILIGKLISMDKTLANDGKILKAASRIDQPLFFQEKNE